MAPNYLAEEYAGVASYSEEDDDVRQTTCPVKVQFSPFHPEQPGLRICYSYKNLVCTSFLKILYFEQECETNISETEYELRKTECKTLKLFTFQL